MSSLPKSYDPKAVEEKWYTFWETKGFFHADPRSPKKPYAMVIPPPNVTGVLHMGHALVDTLQDILIRYQRMQGFEAVWFPGTDHAGISTQFVVEKDLFQTTGRRRQEFSREEFLQHVWNWKERSEKEILGQLKRLGCCCDWSRLRFTMDAQCSRAVRAAFKKLFDDGLIYRGNRLVNWDPVTQTALSDDEVEYEEREGFLWHIRYPFVDGSGALTVATTRPETMLGDVAVAVHPEDPRYQRVVGKMVLLPLVGRKIPILADTFVDSTWGSGAVKITPAHDFQDFEVGQRHFLAEINIMSPEGKINEVGGKYQGFSMEEARREILKDLEKAGLIEKTEKRSSRVGLSYRSKAVVEPYLSKQWFVKMAPFREKLFSAVREKRVKLIPDHWESVYFHWIENLRDWCISRQIWWGHQIPIWYRRDDPETLLCFAGEGIPPEVTKEPDKWVQDSDVLDTWFSSALWPLSVMGWPEKTEEFDKFYPTTLLVTGHDILFFWVARMIFMGEYLTGKVPFHAAFLHGLIYGKSYWRRDLDGAVHYLKKEEKNAYDLGAPLPADVDSKWEKMSKTKGNVIDPLEMIYVYGTDAVRMALASSTTYAQQIDLDLRKFEEFKNFANKVWNGARFVLMHVEDLSLEEFSRGLDMSAKGLEDRWILSTLNRVIEEVHQGLSAYAFDKVAMRAYDFFWNEFCAVFVELAKPALFGKGGNPSHRVQKQKLLAILLLHAICLLHPFTPFITEEIFSALREKFPGAKPSDATDPYTKYAMQALASPACIAAPYPRVIEPKDPHAERDFDTLQAIVRAIRNIRTEMQMVPSEKTELVLCGSPEEKEMQVAKAHQSLLFALTPTSRLVMTVEEPKALGATAQVGACRIFIPIPESFRTKEKTRLEKEHKKWEKMIESTRTKLASEEFRTRAPREVVERLEANLAEATQALEEAVKKLRDLQSE